MKSFIAKIPHVFVLLFLTNTLLVAQPHPIQAPPVERPKKVQTEIINEASRENKGEIKKPSVSFRATLGNGRLITPGQPVRLKEYRHKTLEELKKQFPGKNLFFENEKGEKEFTYYPRSKEFRLSKDVVIKANDMYKLEDIQKFIHHQYTSSSIHIASIVDETSDKPMVKKLEVAAKKNKVWYKRLDHKNLEASFEEAANGVLVITSHYEDKKLFARSSDNQAIANKIFSEEELNALAKKHNVKLVFLGCKTEEIGNGSGLKESVIDQDVAKVVNNVIDYIGSNNTISRDKLCELLVPENNTLVVSTLDIDDENAPIKIEIHPVRRPALRDNNSDTTNNTIKMAATGHSNNVAIPTIIIIGGFVAYGLYKRNTSKHKTA